MIETVSVNSFEQVQSSSVMQILRPPAQESQEFAQTLAAQRQRGKDDPKQSAQAGEKEPQESDEKPAAGAGPSLAQGLQAETRVVDRHVAELQNDVSLAQRNAAELAHQSPIPRAKVDPEESQADSTEPRPDRSRGSRVVPLGGSAHESAGAQSRSSQPDAGEHASRGPAVPDHTSGEGASGVPASAAGNPAAAGQTARMGAEVSRATGSAGSIGATVSSAAGRATTTGTSHAKGAGIPVSGGGATGFREVMARLGAKAGRPFVTRSEEATAAQAARIVAQGLRDGKTEVVMRLRPETLGPVKIELSMNEGALSARIEASTPAARELLEASMDQLRAALEARGLVVQEMNVAHVSSAHESGSPEAGAWSEDPAHERHGPGGEREGHDGRSQQHWGDGAEPRSPGSAAGLSSVMGRVDIERSDLGVIRIDALI